MAAIASENVSGKRDPAAGRGRTVGHGSPEVRFENLDLCPTYMFENDSRFIREEVSAC